MRRVAVFGAVAFAVGWTLGGLSMIAWAAWDTGRRL